MKRPEFDRLKNGWQAILDFGDDPQMLDEIEQSMKEHDHTSLQEMIRDVATLVPSGWHKPDLAQAFFHVHDPREDCIRIVVVDDPNADDQVVLH